MIDLEKPMHFTKEQSEWIKQYVILKRKEVIDDTIQEIHDNVYEQGVRDFAKWLIDKKVDNYSDIVDLVNEYVSINVHKCP